MNQVATPNGGTARIQGELWAARAGDWSALQEVVFRPLYEAVLSHREIGEPASCLDVGCGSGLAAEVFASKISSIAGIDACSAFVNTARKRVPAGDFRVGEMEALPFEDATFDLVTGFNAFQYAASPLNALREARRVVKPGKHVVMATWGLPQDCEAAGHLKALGALMPPPPAGAPGPFALSDEARAKEIVREAGLTPVALADVDCPWMYPDLETALRAMLSAGPAEKAVRASNMERAREAVKAAIAPFRAASGGYHLKNKFRYLIAQA
jgi:SAM-dependent methyltransferase